MANGCLLPPCTHWPGNGFPRPGPFSVPVILSAAGIALDVAWLPRWTGPAMQAPAAHGELVVRGAQRCPHCGRIESKREIVPKLADPLSPKIYEYTLRMADGSSRVFQEALPVSWRVGERLTLIDGEDPAPD